MDKKLNSSETKYIFHTLEEAIEILKLDKRTNWFVFQGKIVKKAKGDKLGHKYPEPLIINGNYIYVEN